jgi:hypothetical protein
VRRSYTDQRCPRYCNMNQPSLSIVPLTWRLWPLLLAHRPGMKRPGSKQRRVNPASSPYFVTLPELTLARQISLIFSWMPSMILPGWSGGVGSLMMKGQAEG